MNPLLFSADYSLENGQAVVTREVANTTLGDRDQVREIIYRPGSSVASMGSWALATCKALFFLAARRPEFIYVVVSRTLLGFLRDIPILSYSLLGGRVVVHCHGSDLEDLLNDRWYSPIARVLYARCEVIFPCKYLAQRLEHIVAQAHVCENFLADAPQMLPAVGSVAHSEPLTVLWNSNVMASKGYLDVAEAVKRCADGGHAIRFVSFGAILGDTEMSARELASELSRYSQYNWFGYLGRVPHNMAVSHLQDCDVVALPSRYPSEMQPLAIIEAMCTGRHVVISDRPSLRATLGDYPASIVNPARVDDIVAILVELCRQKAEDPIGFANANLEPAELARDRYSVERFRERMSFILLRGPQGMD